MLGVRVRLLTGPHACVCRALCGRCARHFAVGAVRFDACFSAAGGGPPTHAGVHPYPRMCGRYYQRLLSASTASAALGAALAALAALSAALSALPTHTPSVALTALTAALPSSVSTRPTRPR